MEKFYMYQVVNGDGKVVFHSNDKQEAWDWCEEFHKSSSLFLELRESKVDAIWRSKVRLSESQKEAVLARDKIIQARKNIFNSFEMNDLNKQLSKLNKELGI